MAEPIGVISGLVGLATVAYNASVSLCDLIRSFKSRQRELRELQGELETLNTVLESLSGLLKSGDPDLEALELPLKQCGQACTDFRELLSKWTVHSSESAVSFRDWAKLRYMGSDIVGFKNMLAGYKATINIAVGGATLRRVAVTASTLNDYKQLIADTTQDLEDHYSEITRHLHSLRTGQRNDRTDGDLQQRRMEEERESAKKCLQICAQVSERIDEFRSMLADSEQAEGGALDLYVPTVEHANGAKVMTARLLEELRQNTSTTALELRRRLERLDSLLNGLPSTASVSNTSTEEQKYIEVELKSIKQCIEICTNASEQTGTTRVNVFEDVAAGDKANQVIVSTLGDLISAKRITVGADSAQWLGQMTDDTLQKLSADRQSASRRPP